MTSLKHPLKILQLDTDATFAKQLILKISAEGINTNVEQIETKKQLTSSLQKKTYDLIFLGDNVKDCSGTDALKAIRKLKVYTPVLVLSDILDEETIVNYINLGATDYILKTSLHRMAAVIKRIISNTRNAKIVDYQNFFETSPDLLCTCDNEGHFMGINPSWGQVFGYTDAEMIDKPFIQFVHADDKKSAAAQFQKLFDEKSKTVDMICRFMTTTEDFKWLHWKMKFQKNGSINVIARDITESKAREVQLVQAHQNMQKLVEIYKADIVKKTLIADQIRDSVVVTDLQGKIVSWNKGSEKVFGYTPEEAVGQHIAMIYPEKDYKYIQDEAANILLEQGTKEFELNMCRKSGEIFEARLTLEVTRDSDGKVNGMLGYAIDMGPVREEVDRQQAESAADSSPEAVAEETADRQLKQENEVEQKADPQEQQEETVVESAREMAEADPVVAGNEQAAQKVETADQEKVEVKAEESFSADHSEQRYNNVAEIGQEVGAEVRHEVVEIPVADSEISIMYMEDNLRNINAVEKILGEREAYRLITTQEPEDCLEIAKQYLPSLILLDMDLPGADSFDLLKQLHQDPCLQNIPIIAVSEDSASEKRENAKQAGFADYLVKPLESNGFLGVIDAQLSRAQSQSIKNASSI